MQTTYTYEEKTRAGNLIGSDAGKLTPTEGDFRREGGGHLGRLRNRWRTSGADQFRPDPMPIALAEIPATQLEVDGGLYAHGLFSPHVAPSAQALVQVLLVDACGCSQAAAVFGRNMLGHVTDDSDSLGFVQAIRYRVNASEALESRQMETASERRRRKLKHLCDKHGLENVARKAQVNPASLDQILKGVLLPPKKDGSRSARSLGNSAAHAIEDAYALGRGWFDLPDEMESRLGALRMADLSAEEVSVVTAYRYLGHLDDGLQASFLSLVNAPARLAELLALLGDIGDEWEFVTFAREFQKLSKETRESWKRWIKQAPGQTPYEDKGTMFGSGLLRPRRPRKGETGGTEGDEQ